MSYALTVKVEEQFADFREKQRMTPEAALKDEISNYKGQVQELVRRTRFALHYTAGTSAGG